MAENKRWSLALRIAWSMMIALDTAMMPITIAAVLKTPEVYQGYDENGTHFGYGGCGLPIYFWWPCDAPVTFLAGIESAIFGIVASVFAFVYANTKVTLRSVIYIPMLLFASIGIFQYAMYAYGAEMVNWPPYFNGIVMAGQVGMMSWNLIAQRREQRKKAVSVTKPAAPAA